MTTRAPSAASATAIAAPMPLVDPAMRARRPVMPNSIRESSGDISRHCRYLRQIGTQCQDAESDTLIRAVCLLREVATRIWWAQPKPSDYRWMVIRQLRGSFSPAVTSIFRLTAHSPYYYT